MNWVAALAIALFILLYLRSPIDLVPDRIGLPGLLDDLLLLLAGVWWIRRRLRAAAPRARRAEEQPQDAGTVWDPYSVLGVGHDASQEEISRAYREQMKRYHPDRVASLGDELQQLAHRKTVEIQRAYAEIGRA